MSTATLGTYGDILAGNGHFATVAAVECGNAVTPPKLTGNTPVVYVFHPVDIDLGEAFGFEFNLAVENNLECRLCKRFHFNEPLVGCDGFNGGVATVAGANVVRVRNGLNEIAFCFEVGNKRLASLVTVHAAILAAVNVDGSIIVHNLEYGQVVTLTNEEVVGVVSRGDLYATGTKADFYVIVGNNGNFSTRHGQNKGFADEMLCIFIVGVHCNCGVTEHCFGTSGSNLYVAIFALDRVLDVPEEAVLLGIFNLCIRESGDTLGAPVDNAVAAIDKSFFVKVYKYLANCARATLVKGEALTCPVAGCTKLFELTGDASFVFILPFPNSFQKLLATKVIARETFFKAQSFFNLNLGCNTCVVGSGNPKGVKALHSLITNENVLQGLVKRVTHVQLTRYVGGRNNYGEMLRIVGNVGSKVSLFAPFLINSVLKLRRRVCFGQFVVLIHLSRPPEIYIHLFFDKRKSLPVHHQDVEARGTT